MRVDKFTAVIVLVLVSVSGCVQTQEPPEQPPDFETISRGGFGGLDEQGDYVIDSEGEWSELLNRTRIRFQEPPAIDFSRSTVIAVFLGTRSTGGYTIEIKDIAETDDEVTVYVEETSPGPGENVIMAVTQPYHIVKTKKITKEVIFER